MPFSVMATIIGMSGVPTKSVLSEQGDSLIRVMQWLVGIGEWESE